MRRSAVSIDVNETCEVSGRRSRKSQTWICQRVGKRRGTSSRLKAQRDALFADDCEAVKQVCQPKQLTNPLAQVQKLKAAALCLGRHHQAHQGAQSHAVHVRYIGEIENDAALSREELADATVKVAGYVRDEATVQVDNNRFALLFDGNIQRAGSCRFSHLGFPGDGRPWGIGDDLLRSSHDPQQIGKRESPRENRASPFLNGLSKWIGPIV